MKKFTQTEDEIIVNGVDNKLSWNQISEEIEDKTGTKRSVESVRCRYKKLRKGNPSLEPMKNNIQNSVTTVIEEEKEKFSVSKDNLVTWKYRHGMMELPLDSLDDIFYRYSRHGLNMSQVKIQNHYGLTAIQWQSLKRTFDLVKDSDVFSPYSLSLVSGKEATQMIAQKIAEKYSPKNMREVVAYEDDKQKRSAYDKAIKISSQLDYRRQIFETEILDYIEKSKTKIVSITNKKGQADPIVAHVCDLHIGANIQGEKNLPEFNADIVLDRLLQSAKHINAVGSKEVTLVLNGDLIETFTGLSHINSWKNIDMKYGYGVKATIKAHEIIVQFIQAVHNIKEVIIVAGNHDRVTSNNQEDIEGEVVQWIHYMLSANFGHLFNVSWSKDIIQRTINNISYLFTHGHLSLSKKSPAHLVTEYGVYGMFNVIVEGHLHSRVIKADSINYRHIAAPSIFTGNDYSKNLGYSTVPGMLIFSGYNYPTVTDIPLN